jgi:vancomycin resistance protein VanW
MSSVSVSKPVSRSQLRYKAAYLYHSLKRYGMWLLGNRRFAADISSAQLPYVQSRHRTILLRRLKDVDMQYQYNKIVNLRLAAQKLNGVIVHPGDTFSYWRLIGKPTYRKGYVDGMVLSCGVVKSGCGGGLCQLSNLIYWLTLHTPLAVEERHRHGYDVFPDSDRTQPFGSGATCFYPYGDLMIKNTTDIDYQLCVRVGDEYLEGEWRSVIPSERRYEIIEKNHEFKGEYWGGFSRHNELYRRAYDLEGNLLNEEFVTANHALMMYSPFIAETAESEAAEHM